MANVNQPVVSIKIENEKKSAGNLVYHYSFKKGLVDDKDVRQRMQDILERFADETKKKIKKSISDKYIRKVNESKPGEYPKRRTGKLRDGMMVDATISGAKRIPTFQLELWNKQKYWEYLNKGVESRNLKPRPIATRFFKYNKKWIDKQALEIAKKCVEFSSGQDKKD